MKIIAGANKGRYLKVPGRGTRPTRGMIRQAVFDVLGDSVLNAAVLDLFAGSGALGIEALSRGAGSCVFVEKNPRALRSNIQACGLDRDRIVLFMRDFRFGLRKLAGARFDLIFIDPPYGKGFLDTAVSLVTRYRLLKPGGIVIAEHSSGETVAIPPALAVIKEKTYGETTISFLTWEGK
jgi:16S rRNA (guanine966-N2)-methyltransferase